jgi:hypothetical protein
MRKAHAGFQRLFLRDDEYTPHSHLAIKQLHPCLGGGAFGYLINCDFITQTTGDKITIQNTVGEPPKEVTRRDSLPNSAFFITPLNN